MPCGLILALRIAGQSFRRRIASGAATFRSRIRNRMFRNRASSPSSAVCTSIAEERDYTQSLPLTLASTRYAEPHPQPNFHQSCTTGPSFSIPEETVNSNTLDDVSSSKSSPQKSFRNFNFESFHSRKDEARSTAPPGEETIGIATSTEDIGNTFESPVSLQPGLFMMERKLNDMSPMFNGAVSSLSLEKYSSSMEEQDLLSIDVWNKPRQLKLYLQFPKLLAEELTLIDVELFCKIEQRELEGGTWAKRDKRSASPNVLKMIESSNRLAQIVCTEIVHEKTISSRAKAITSYIKIASKLFKIHNYNSMMAVISGLQSQAVYRLEKSWNQVPSRKIKKFKRYSNFLVISGADQFRNLMQYNLRNNIQCIPLLDWLLANIASYYQTFKKLEEENGIVPSPHLPSYLCSLSSRNSLRESVALASSSFHSTNGELEKHPVIENGSYKCFTKCLSDTDLQKRVKVSSSIKAPVSFREVVCPVNENRNFSPPQLSCPVAFSRLQHNHQSFSDGSVEESVQTSTIGLSSSTGQWSPASKRRNRLIKQKIIGKTVQSESISSLSGYVEDSDYCLPAIDCGSEDDESDSEGKNAYLVINSFMGASCSASSTSLSMMSIGEAFSSQKPMQPKRRQTCILSARQHRATNSDDYFDNTLSIAGCGIAFSSCSYFRLHSPLLSFFQSEIPCEDVIKQVQARSFVNSSNEFWSPKDSLVFSTALNSIPNIAECAGTPTGNHNCFLDDKDDEQVMMTSESLVPLSPPDLVQYQMNTLSYSDRFTSKQYLRCLISNIRRLYENQCQQLSMEIEPFSHRSGMSASSLKEFLLMEEQDLLSIDVHNKPKQLKLYLQLPKLLAEELTLTDADLFCKIEPAELEGGAWAKRNKHSTSPNVLKMIESSNMLSRIVCTEVVHEETISNRAKAITSYIKIARKLYKIHNYYSMMAIVSGLESQAVYRLEKSWNQVPSRSRKKLEKCSNFISKMFDADKFRKLMQYNLANSIQCIPFLSWLLTNTLYYPENEVPPPRYPSSCLSLRNTLQESVGDLSLPFTLLSLGDEELKKHSATKNFSYEVPHFTSCLSDTNLHLDFSTTDAKVDFNCPSNEHRKSSSPQFLYPSVSPVTVSRVQHNYQSSSLDGSAEESVQFNSAVGLDSSTGQSSLTQKSLVKPPIRQKAIAINQFSSCIQESKSIPSLSDYIENSDCYLPIINCKSENVESDRNEHILFNSFMGGSCSSTSSPSLSIVSVGEAFTPREQMRPKRKERHRIVVLSARQHRVESLVKPDDSIILFDGCGIVFNSCSYFKFYSPFLSFFQSELPSKSFIKQIRDLFVNSSNEFRTPTDSQIDLLQFSNSMSSIGEAAVNSIDQESNQDYLDDKEEPLFDEQMVTSGDDVPLFLPDLVQYQTNTLTYFDKFTSKRYLRCLINNIQWLYENQPQQFSMDVEPFNRRSGMSSSSHEEFISSMKEQNLLYDVFNMSVKQMKLYLQCPKLLAEELTLLDAELFCKIEQTELEDKYSTSPNILKMMESFNRLSRIACTEVVLEETVSSRVKAITSYIKIAGKLYKIHNYHSMMAIICGLDSQAVHRLEESWNQVPSKKIRKLEKYSNFVTKMYYDGFKNLMQYYLANNIQCIPYLDWLLRSTLYYQKLEEEEGMVHYTSSFLFCSSSKNSLQKSVGDSSIPSSPLHSPTIKLKQMTTNQFSSCAEESKSIPSSSGYLPVNDCNSENVESQIDFLQQFSAPLSSNSLSNITEAAGNDQNSNQDYSLDDKNDHELLFEQVMPSSTEGCVLLSPHDFVQYQTNALNYCTKFTSRQHMRRLIDTVPWLDENQCHQVSMDIEPS